MSQSNKPITPKADHRVIEAETTHRTQNNRTNSNAAGKGNDKPLKAKFSFGEWLSNSRLVRWLRNLVWLFLISVVAMLAYLSWSNNQNDWQIEHINELQSQMSQLRGSVKTLQTKQAKLEQALLNRKDASQAEATPAILAKIEMLDDLQSQVKALATKLGDMEVRLDAGLSTSVSDASQGTSKAEPVQKTAEDDQLTPLRQTMAQLKTQLASLQSAQQALEVKNETLTAKLSAEPKPTTEAGYRDMTASKIRQWATEINLKWVMQGDVEQTKQTLKALEQVVGLSQLPEKNRLIRQIGEDLNALTNQVGSSSLNSARQALKQTKNWLTQLDLAPSVLQEVSHETSDKPETVAEPALSVWQKIEQKLMSLFSIKKRAQGDNLTAVEKLVQQDVLKQRMLLLLDRVEWALVANSQQQLETSRQALADYVQQQLPQESATFKSLFKPVETFRFQSRHSLKIVGEE
ncbi:MAG: hypothetical protein R3219_06725 [Hydrogenovibrio sp.]|nr:hypothetical protein [Hydrogenovibrio sp.]